MPSTIRTRWPARSASAASSVPSAPARPSAIASASTSRRNACGVWARKTDSRAIVRSEVSASDRPAPSGRVVRRRPLHRVAGRNGHDGGARLGGGVDRALDRRRVHERPGGVVDQHDVARRRHGVEPVRHRVLSPVPARDQATPPDGAGTAGGASTHSGGPTTMTSLTRSARQERVDAPLEHRPAAEVEQLLRHRGSEPAAAASGGDDGGNVHTRSDRVRLQAFGCRLPEGRRLRAPDGSLSPAALRLTAHRPAGAICDYTTALPDVAAAASEDGGTSRARPIVLDGRHRSVGGADELCFASAVESSASRSIPRTHGRTMVRSLATLSILCLYRFARTDARDPGSSTSRTVRAPLGESARALGGRLQAGGRRPARARSAGRGRDRSSAGS